MLPNEIIQVILGNLHMPDIYAFLKTYPQFKSLDFKYINRLAQNNHKNDKSGWIYKKCKWCGHNMLNKNSR